MGARGSGEEPIGIGERCATGLVSAVVTLLTLLAYFVISLKLSLYGPGVSMRAVFDMFCSKLSVGLISAATVAGFALGSSRMAEVFSFFWFTHEWWQEKWGIKVMGVAWLLLLAWGCADLFLP